jgi:hypothetical protein
MRSTDLLEAARAKVPGRYCGPCVSCGRRHAGELTILENAKQLIQCFGGCPREELLRALGIGAGRASDSRTAREILDSGSPGTFFTRCPLCDQTLWLRIDDGGVVRVRCRGSCDWKLVRKALGLGFDPVPRTLDEELAAHLARRASVLGYAPPVRSCDRNYAAERFEATHTGATAPRFVPEPWEGDSRDSDPEWPALVLRRLYEAALRAYPEWSGLDRTPSQAEIDEARRLAAGDLRSLTLPQAEAQHVAA